MKCRILVLFVIAFFAIASSSVVNAEDTGTVTVIHAISGDDLGTSFSREFPVEVSLTSGGDTVSSFDLEFLETFGPEELPEGLYGLTVELKELSVTLEGEDVFIQGGKNFTVIAHLTFSGSGDPPTPGVRLSVFENNIDPILAGRARLTVRHTANAPRVAVKLSRKGIVNLFSEPVAFPGIGNRVGGEAGESGPVDLRAGVYEVALLAESGQLNDFSVFQKVFRSGRVFPKPRTSFIVYAIGDFFGETFQLFIQTIDLDSAVIGHKFP
jgi:hypothetical protein